MPYIFYLVNAVLEQRKYLQWPNFKNKEMKTYLF